MKFLNLLFQNPPSKRTSKSNRLFIVVTLIVVMVFLFLQRGFAQKISGGGYYTLAVCNDGTVQSWGTDGNGQLGDNIALVDQPTPVTVATITNVTAVSGGWYHSLALDNTGMVWSWGYDGWGQLGNDAALVQQNTPVTVGSPVIAIAAGRGHSLALDNTGKVWSWGDDGAGQLGNDAALVNQPTPVAVSVAWGGNTIVAIAVGMYYSLALDNTGKVWSWGSDGFGQLGNNAALVDQPTPVAVSVAWGGNTIVSIAAGMYHAFALDNTGKLWSWGYDNFGQLGNNAALVDQPTPVAVSVAWGANIITAIAGGKYHSLARDNTGKVWSWGMDDQGQLGNNAALVSQSTPVAVSVAWGANTITNIAAGHYHSLARDNLGNLWSWGFDNVGQLGNNAALVDQPTPVLVPSCIIALPIKLISFTADSYQDNSVLCNWVTASEINNDYFTLEKSTDAINFSPFAIVDGAGNSSQTLNYQYIDYELYRNLSYYRLKQTDFDGNFTYSQVISVVNQQINQSTLNVYPNPSNGKVVVALGSGGWQSIECYNVLGEKLGSWNLDLDMKEITIDISSYSKGMYFLKTNDGIKQEQVKLIKDQNK